MPTCFCCEREDEDDGLYCPCYACLQYHNIHNNICFKCEEDGTAVFASRFWYNTGPNGPGESDTYLFCSASCCAQFNLRDIMYPRVFAIGKLSLSLKRLKERNYERNYWVNTLIPVIFGAARDPNKHPVWNYLYQERKALLIPLLPTLAMTHLAHDLPYYKSTRNTKLKEPCVLLTKNMFCTTLASWKEAWDESQRISSQIWHSTLVLSQGSLAYK